MPFTFSHPAAVLPFLRVNHSALAMSALVIGSITPDFEYFFKMKLSGRYSHTWEGMFLLDLPMAILISIVFHQVVKKPLIGNLPHYFSGRLQPLYNVNFIVYLKSNILPFVVCLLVGIASHIVWDSFTHANSYFVDHIEFLSAPVVVNGLPTVPVFRYVQHISTALGAIAILVVFHRQQVQPVNNVVSIPYWIIMLLISVVVFFSRASIGFEYFGDIVTSIISSGLIGLIVASIYTRLRHG